MGKMGQAAAGFIAAAVGIGLGVDAKACTEFTRIDNGQVKVLLEQVKDPKIPELDRGFAFETLICDDRPHVREQAMKEALAAADSAMLRSIVLAQILYQTKTLRVELQETPQIGEATKRFIRENQGLLSLTTTKSFPVNACINLGSGNECREDYRVRIQGTKIDLKLQSDSDGVLELKDGGVLVGYFRPWRNANLVPARISLF